MNVEGMIGVATRPAATGKYYVSVEYPTTRAWDLTPASALRYARCLVMAAARAEYDAAVMRQLVAIETPRDEAAAIVHATRGGRSDLSCLDRQVTLSPGVSAFTGAPLLLVTVAGGDSFQLTPDAAREHAMGVLEAIEVAELDSTYATTLQKRVGTTRGVAQNVVASLPRHRMEEPE